MEWVRKALREVKIILNGAVLLIGWCVVIILMFKEFRYFIFGNFTTPPILIAFILGGFSGLIIKGIIEDVYSIFK